MNESKCLQIVIEAVSPFAPPEANIQPDTDLLTGRLIESMNMISILLALEGRLGITLSPADMTFDDFKTCRTLSRVMMRRLEAV